MNDCTLYDMQLAAYAAVELSEPELGAVRDHLARCGKCRAELAREQELRAVLGSLPAAICPAAVSDAVTQRISTGQSRRSAPLTDRSRAGARWPAALGLVAAAILAILLVPGLLRESPPAGPPAAGIGEPGEPFSRAEIEQARREFIMTLALAADVLDRSRDRTVVDVFGAQLPRAISSSLHPHASDAQVPTNNTNAAQTGGKG